MQTLIIFFIVYVLFLITMLFLNLKNNRDYIKDAEAYKNKLFNQINQIKKTGSYE